MPDNFNDKPSAILTLRQQIQKELEQGAMTCRELSQSLHQSEREILDHLEHLRLTLRHCKQKLEITAACCRRCGFTFEHRKRLAKPGKCPECRHTSIEPPLYSITER